MTKFLDSGAIIPHGLLSCDPSDFKRGMEKTYSSTALRFGVIKKIYYVDDPDNISKSTTEYDVDVIEQDKNRGIAPITYKHCVAVDSLGSISDYFEKNFRVQTQSDNFQLPITAGQNGAIVILLCLDATMGKGVILGGLNHPNRKTNLTSSEPQLYGNYNGVAVQINPDGSTSLTFNGATDNNGNLVTPGQGPTTVQIATDGSFSIQNAGVTMQLEKGGTINITCTGPANIIAQGTTTVDGSTIKLGENAIESVIKGNTFATIYNNHTHIGDLGFPTSPPNEVMDPSLSQHTFTE